MSAPGRAERFAKDYHWEHCFGDHAVLIPPCVAAALETAVREERERWQREAIDAIPTCSTDGDDYRMAKLAARGWRALANRVYVELMNLRDQVLRYRVPADPKYIDALNRIDVLIREHDAAIRREGA